jgi:hypothetical protein
MKRKTLVAASVLVLAFVLLLATSMPAITQTGPYNYVTLGVRSAFTVLGKAIVGDSLRVQGNLKVNKYLYASSTKAWGVRIWGTTVSNPDTLLVNGVDSTCCVILQPIMTNMFTTGDTTGTLRLYAKVNNSTNGKITDTIFVYQCQTTTVRRIKYSYFVGHPSS